MMRPEGRISAAELPESRSFQSLALHAGVRREPERSGFKGHAQSEAIRKRLRIWLTEPPRFDSLRKRAQMQCDKFEDHGDAVFPDPKTARSGGIR